MMPNACISRLMSLSGATMTLVPSRKDVEHAQTIISSRPPSHVFWYVAFISHTQHILLNITHLLSRDTLPIIHHRSSTDEEIDQYLRNNQVQDCICAELLVDLESLAPEIRREIAMGITLKQQSVAPSRKRGAPTATTAPFMPVLPQPSCVRLSFSLYIFIYQDLYTYSLLNVCIYLFSLVVPTER